jgi:hypothetical protein
VPVRKKRPAKAKAKRPLDSLKYEVARELDLPKEVPEETWALKCLLSKFRCCRRRLSVAVMPWARL